MKSHQEHKALSNYIIFPLLFVFMMWSVFWVEETFGYNFNKYGIYPRTVKGLRGILFSPFIHANFTHIFNNTIPLFVLSFFLFLHYKSITWKVLLWGWLLTGIGTWLLGRPSYHIGMSGINYMLVSFLFFSGVFSKYYRLMAVSLTVVFLYGSLVWLMFPIVDYISWEGHLSGFIAGLLLAFAYGKQLQRKYQIHKKVKMYPKDDEFLKHFDENGNFIEDIETDEIKQGQE